MPHVCFRSLIVPSQPKHRPTNSYCWDAQWKLCKELLGDLFNWHTAVLCLIMISGHITDTGSVQHTQCATISMDKANKAILFNGECSLHVAWPSDCHYQKRGILEWLYVMSRTSETDGRSSWGCSMWHFENLHHCWCCYSALARFVFQRNNYSSLCGLRSAMVSAAEWRKAKLREKVCLDKTLFRAHRYGRVTTGNKKSSEVFPMWKLIAWVW